MMETPTADVNRRTTRSALAEIPTRLGMLSMNDRMLHGRRSLNNNTQNTINTLATNNDTLNSGMLSALLTPSSSPDEMVIQQRGRRRIPVVWSPDIDELKKAQQERDDHKRTPVKQNLSSFNSSSSNSIVLRSTPRKRLLLTDPLDVFTLSPDRNKKSAPINKKSKIDHRVDISEAGVSNALKALTADQLITVVEKLLEKNSSLESDLKEALPEPDLLPLEDNLITLKRNISKSLPTSRLISKTDSSAYKRAAIHVLSFKNTLLEQGQRLVDSQQWSAVMDYVLMAWNIVRDTPQWDFASHNILRRQCFKGLTTFCQIALKNGQFPADELTEYYESMKEFIEDNSGFDMCLKQISNIHTKKMVY